MIVMTNNRIAELNAFETDLVAGGELTAEEVVAAGALAIRTGMTVAAVNPAVGAAIAAAGATAVLFGGLASSLND